jgi:hypothetical protein
MALGPKQMGEAILRNLEEKNGENIGAMDFYCERIQTGG